MSHDALYSIPPAVLRVGRDLRLRDIAKLNARVEDEVLAGTRHITVRGARTLTEGSRHALISLRDRLARGGVQLVFENSISSAA